VKWAFLVALLGLFVVLAGAARLADILRLKRIEFTNTV
jgi:hypothetical protein